MQRRPLFLLIILASFLPVWSQVRGDLTDDGIVDVSDVNTVIDIVLGKDVPPHHTFTVNGVKFNMVEVPGGTFTMGATSEQGSECDSDERPVHQVTLSDFSIGATEVTQELWQAVMGSNPSWFNGCGNSNYGSSHSAENYGTDLQRPVECVSWADCQIFISRLNELTGMTFRLPTEAEWEYAARGGSKSKEYMYAGGGNIDEVAWYWDNVPSSKPGVAGYGTQPVGTKMPNELGLYDMSGNVCEWCQDWYGEYVANAPANPTGQATGTVRVYRGGCWFSFAGCCRVSFRFNDSPDYRDYFLGLRLAM